MKNCLCSFVILSLSCIFVNPVQAQFTDGENDRQCREGKYERENCTLVRRIGLQDPETGDVTYVYKNWGNGFNKSKQKSDYKRQGLETKGVDFQKRGSTPYYGLRDANDKLVLSTSYPNLWPVSARYSFVWLSNSTYKMVEHKTHTLQPTPIGWKQIFQFRNSDDILNTWVKTVDKGHGIGTWRRVNPDLTLGMTIENVFFLDNGPFKEAVPGFTNIGAQGVAITKDPQTGEAGSIIFSIIEDSVDTDKAAGVFEVIRADKYGKEFTSIVTMKHLGARLPNIGETFPRDLYWPVDASGLPIARSADVLGMAPIYNNTGEVTKWIVVQATRTGFEYLIGVEKYENSARPIEVLKRVDELDAYEDIYFFGRNNNFAVKVVDENTENPWRVNYRLPENLNHSVNARYSSGPEAYAGVVEAAQQLKTKQADVIERNRLYHEEVTREVNRLLGHIQTSPRIAECDMIERYAKSLNQPSQEARNWLAVNQLDGYRACRYIPVRLANDARAATATTGTAAPTLSDMLEEFGRNVAKAPTVLRCTKKGDGTETCQWVNR